MAIVKKLDSNRVRLRWDVDTNVVTASCDSIHLASKYLATLVVSKRITSISAIIFSYTYPSKIVELYAGKRIEKFHHLAHEQKYRTRTKLTDILGFD